MEIVIENQSPNDVVATSMGGGGGGGGGVAAPAQQARVIGSQNPIPGTYSGDPVPSSSTIGGDYYGWHDRSRLPFIQPESNEMIHGLVGKTSVRRVDRLGILEIPELEPASRTRPRHLTGAENVGGTLSRRIDRSGVLEVVPEVPDQQPTEQAQRDPDNDFVMTTIPSTTPTPTTTTTIATIEDNSHDKNFITERQLTGAEVPEERQPTSLSPRPSDLECSSIRRRSLAELHSTLDKIQMTSEGQENTKSRPSSTSPIFHSRLLPRTDDQLTTQTLGRNIRNRVQFPKKCLLDQPQRRHYFGSMNLTNHPTTTIRKITKGSDEPSTDQAHGSTVNQNENKVPQGERAEAEGCEHTTVDGLEESRVPFKPANNKILHNDNIQTLRVIILSEDL